MKKFISKILSKIASSSIQGNATSTPRVQSYIILVPILLMSTIFMGFEVSHLIYCLYTAKDYAISAEIIIIFGMLLSHHLALIFSRGKSQSITDIKGTGSPKTEETDNLPVPDEEVNDENPAN
jgi:hypothetical protein